MNKTSKFQIFSQSSCCNFSVTISYALEIRFQTQTHSFAQVENVNQNHSFKLNNKTLNSVIQITRKTWQKLVENFWTKHSCESDLAI